MTGRVINRETAGFLVLLIPLAIAAVILLTAWPYILGLIGLIMAVKLWQNYQWLQWCEKINPFFNQLIKENKGCLTPMDLSLKANLTGGTAKRFLERKAEEYGAQRKHLEDKGIVYYFLTASALGSIFDESEPLPLLEEKTIPSLKSAALLDSQPEQSAQISAPAATNSSSATETRPQEPSVENKLATSPVNAVAQSVEFEEKPPQLPVEEKTTSVEEPQSRLNSIAVQDAKAQDRVTSQQIEQDSEAAKPENQTQQNVSDQSKLELIQADLAKRLEINPSTVGRRKTDPDFAEWSQSKDPDGIAWKYKRKTKTFVPIEEEK